MLIMSTRRVLLVLWGLCLNDVQVKELRAPDSHNTSLKVIKKLNP